MYLPSRNTGPGPVHEYLMPGVEIVAVDPECAYDSPITLSSDSSGGDDDDDDDDCDSVATDEYLMQVNRQSAIVGNNVADTIAIEAAAADDNDDDDDVIIVIAEEDCVIVHEMRTKTAQKCQSAVAGTTTTKLTAALTDAVESDAMTASGLDGSVGAMPSSLVDTSMIGKIIKKKIKFHT